MLKGKLSSMIQSSNTMREEVCPVFQRFRGQSRLTDDGLDEND